MDQLAITTLRMLAADAVQTAKPGHPGAPMDAAPTAYALWRRFPRYLPIVDRTKLASASDVAQGAYRDIVLPPEISARVSVEEAANARHLHGESRCNWE